ncbi:MAG: DNA polymerase III subunit gamma/tau [Oscillospiraceae bacterium]
MTIFLGVSVIYLALYRKWRPLRFEDVISQPHITVTLKNEVQTQQTAHAYLFTGPRGTGKTTCSKILAMAVNCLNPIDGDPCLSCEICRGIEDNTILDVVEIDAASNNGVDNIRELRDEANYTPAQCKYRVYIIDEAHMLSIGAFNALLKIMEEPPPHVKFILATTEAHKIPATILSRCQRFDFRRIKSEDIVTRLLKITESEEFTLTKEAAELIARLADGGMRDALSILDQCVAFSKDVDVQTLTQAVGIVGREYLFALCSSIVNEKPQEALLLIDELYASSKDLQSLCEELIHVFRNIMICKTCEDTQGLIDVLPEELEKTIALAKKFKLSDILDDITILQETLDKMGKVPNKKLLVEICMIKLSSPKQEKNNKPCLQEKEVASEEVKRTNSQLPPPPIKPQMETSEVVEKAPTVKLEPLMKWAEILQELSKEDKPLFGLLSGSLAYVFDGFLYIDSPMTMISKMIKQEGNAARLVRVVEQKTGVKYRIRIKTNKSANTSSSNILDDVIAKAKGAGIDINEK